MASQYKLIQNYEDVLWGMASPVLVERMVLSFDKNYGVNVLQITFRNVSNSNIYGLSISLVLKGKDGRPIHAPVDFNYYAIEVPTGKLFGSSEDIIVEKEAVYFEVTVTGADLSNGVRFFETVKLEKMPPGQPISYLGDWEEPFTAKLNELYPKIKPTHMCEDKKIYWRCTCGRIWPDDIRKCPYCKIDKYELLQILPDLRAEAKRQKEEEARLAREEWERQQEEARLAKEEADRIAAEKRAEEERLAAEEEARRREEEERLAEEEHIRQVEEAARKEKLKKKIIAVSAVVGCIALVGVILLLRSRHISREYDEMQVASEETQETRPADIEPQKSNEGDSVSSLHVEPEEKTEPKDPLLVIGSEVSDTDVTTLERLFGYTIESIPNCETVEVNDNWGHIYMDSMVGKENVEDGCISSILVMPREKGGIDVTLYNIDFYTEQDFIEQLEALGYNNAMAVVAAPEKASGTTAMLGLLIKESRNTYGSDNIIGTAVAKGNINVRTGPGTEYPILSTVKVGSELQVIEITDNLWLKVVWPGTEDGTAYTSNTRGTYYEFK